MKRKNRLKKIIPFINNFVEKPLPEKRFIIVLSLSFFLMLLLILSFSQFGSFINVLKPSDFRIGQVAERDVVMDRDLVYIDEKATNLLKETRAGLVHPVFTLRNDITLRVTEQFEAFNNTVSFSIKNGIPHQSVFLEVQKQFPGLFTENDITRILNYSKRIEVLEQAELSIQRMINKGVVSMPRNNEALSETGFIEIRRILNGLNEYEQISLSSVLTLDTFEKEIGLYYPDRTKEFLDLVNLLVKRFLEPNAFYDIENTLKNKERARDEIEPVTVRLLKGEIILQKGFIVTEEDMEKLIAIGAYAATVNFNNLMGTTLYIILLLIISVYIFNPPITLKKISYSKIYLLLSLSVFYLLWCFVVLGVIKEPPAYPLAVYLPSACLSMLVAIIINPRVGILFTFIINLPFFVIFNNGSFYNFIFAVVSGIVGTRVVARAEKRIELIKAGVVISLVNIVVVIILSFLKNLEFRDVLTGLLLAIGNGLVCAIFNLGLLPFFEHLLNAPTVFRLHELSDTNTPLLKKMLTLAPGTYSHSINVAHLAESACRDIGANPLIARVGALYHDIGKIDQAEYFIENQTSSNKHDELKPSLSAAVIKAHVKIGVEKAKELGLPKEVIEIITQHHGRGLISYFYAQAMKSDKKSKVNPEDYSYTESPPTSKESAVVMLADTIEAAARTLKKPTIAKLEKFVGTAILDKLHTGQLIEADITMKDLEIIKRRFVQILAGQFHTRIEYPDIKRIDRGG